MAIGVDPPSIFRKILGVNPPVMQSKQETKFYFPSTMNNNTEREEEYWHIDSIHLE